MNSEKNEVLLLNPPSQNIRDRHFNMPIGLAYLSSFLRNKQVKTKIIDTNPEKIILGSGKDDTFEFLIDRINQFFPDNPPLIIGIGPCMTPIINNALIIAKRLKNKYPKAKIVLGGPHVSINEPKMAIQILKKFPFIDAIVIGEGEETLYQYYLYVKKINQSYPIPGVIYRIESSPSELSSYAEREPPDITKLPVPDIFELSRYLPQYQMAIRRNFTFASNISSDIRKKSKSAVTIISSRGCPFQCAFCCSSKKRRTRTAEDIFLEIKQYHEKYGIIFYVFFDDLFISLNPEDIQRVILLCNKLLNANIQIYWTVELRIEL